MRYFIFTTFIFISCSSSSDEHDKHIIWAITNYPPGFIAEGPEKGKGFADKLTHFMINRLTDHNHSIVTYPSIARLEHQIRHSNNKTICSSALFYRDKEERKLVADRQLYSAPNFVFFLPDIIVKKSKRHLYKEIESYEDLLNNKNLIYGFSHTTGPVTSTILGNYVGLNFDIGLMDVRERLNALSKKKNINIRLGPDNISGQLQMIVRDRLDYLLMYEFSARYEAERLGISDQIVTIPVKETLNNISMAAFSCSNTKTGATVIKSINKILIENRGTNEYKNMLANLLPSSQKRQNKYWIEHDKMLMIYE